MIQGLLMASPMGMRDQQQKRKWQLSRVRLIFWFHISKDITLLEIPIISIIPALDIVNSPDSLMMQARRC
jgi:hypothetical protein